MPSISLSNELQLTKTVYIERGIAPQPNVIVRTHDNGFVIAGLDGVAAWATRTDSEGKVKWRHTTPAIDQPPYEGGAMQPAYHGAAVMPDDSVYLCGKMPRPFKRGAPAPVQPGLLTHLDKDGLVIKEHLLYPNGDNSLSGAFASCIAHGDEVILAGTTFTVISSSENTDKNTRTLAYFYWVLALDKNGITKWEIRLPVAKRMAGVIMPMHIYRNLLGDGFILTAVNSGATEIVHISDKGEAIARTILDDFFTYVRPTKEGDPLQFVSYGNWEGHRDTQILEFDKDLKELNRQVLSPESGGHQGGAYLLPDHSLLLFGAKMVGATVSTARVMKIDPVHKHEETLLLGPELESYWVYDAVLGGAPAEFVSVRHAQKPNRLGQSDEDYARSNPHLGVALDFIKVIKNN